MSWHDDLAYAAESVPELQSYLLSQEIFWPLGASSPRLTLGGLRLAMRRATARAVLPADQTAVNRLTAQLDMLQTKWRAAWEQKAARELRTRLTLWQNYLGDYRLSPESYADAYAVEVRLRVIIELLCADLPSLPDETLALLTTQDNGLRAALVPGKFLWEPALVPAFPPQPFWYLYGTLKPK